MKLGRRDFSQTFSEGIWWVFPLHSFKQQPHFDKLNESEEINISFITTDQIPLDVHVKYYWRVKNLKVLDFNFNPSFIKDTLNYEFGNFIKNRPAIELLADQEISKKVMVNYLEKAGENIGISISNVFPIINYENQYLPVIRKYQEKYKELKFQIEELLMHQFVKNCDIKIYQDMILKCTEDLDLSSFEAMNFMKVYKNQINLNENTYNFPELLKIIEAVLLTLNKKRG